MRTPEKTMTTYTIHHASGVVTTSTAKTLTGAKREASKDMTHGGGSVTIYAGNKPACQRVFWQDRNQFGWGRWENVG